jgi:type I restriction enzyme M protein
MKEQYNFHSSGIKQKIDQIINVLYAGGVNNPMDSIEQISYLLFLKILTEKNNQFLKLSKKYESIFIEKFKNCSWDFLIPLSGQELFTNTRDAIEKIYQLPKMSDIGKMLFNKATLKIMDPATLKVVMMIIEQMTSDLLSESDVKGDSYEYLLKLLSQSGNNGQFRTPRHIIDLIVKLVNPKSEETICDPACGTAGFLISAYDHIVSTNTSKEDIGKGFKSGDKLTSKQWKFLEEQAIWGFDNDINMVKIAILNLYLHKQEKANLNYKNTLTSIISGSYASRKFNVILANPPFAGKIQKESIHEDLTVGFNTRATELLFLKWIADHLKDKGRAGVIVPNGVLFGSTNAHKSIREILLTKCNLQAVISLPSGVFKPYSGVATSVLIFEKNKTTEKVWFYEMENDGFSLDDKRAAIEANDILDIIKKWKDKKESEKSFLVKLKEIKDNNWSLSANLYKPFKSTEHIKLSSPKDLLKDISLLQESISSQISDLNKRIFL